MGLADMAKKFAQDPVIDRYGDRPRQFGLNRLASNLGLFTKLYAAFAAALFVLLNFGVRALLSFEPSALFSGGGAFSATPLLLLPTASLLGLYLLYWLLAAGMWLYLAYHLRVSHAERNVGEKGTQRFTTADEIKAQYKAVPKKGLPFEGRGGFPVAEDAEHIYIDDGPVHNLVLGMTRSGKGEMAVFKMIDIYSRSSERPSLIVADPKLELAAASIPALVARGYDYHILNLIDPAYSMGYSPLTAIIAAYKEGRFDDATNLAGAFCFSLFCPSQPTGQDKYFTDAPTCVLTALILATIADFTEADRKTNEVRRWRHEQKYGTSPGAPPYEESREHEKTLTMYSIVNLFISLSTMWVNERKTELDLFFEARPPEDPSRLLYNTAAIAGERQRGNAFSVMVSSLRVFLTPPIAKMTAESSMNPADIGFGARPTVIFLGLPDYSKANYFLATTFITQTYYSLARMATHAPGGKCARQVTFLLDECGNMPAIDDLAGKTTVSAGRDIYFTFVLQSYSQLKKLYGEDDMKTIRGNCGNTMYIMSADKDTAEEFSWLLGKRTITTVQRSGKKLEISKSFTESHDERALLDPNELQRFMLGECAVFRTMKRTDLMGNKVRPYPIHNSGEGAGMPMFQFRWEYMLDDFPSGNVIYDSPEMLACYKALNEQNREIFGDGYPAIELPVPLCRQTGPDGEPYRIETTDGVDFKARIWDRARYAEQETKKYAAIKDAATTEALMNLAYAFRNDLTAEDIREMKTGTSIRAADLIATADAMKQYPEKRADAMAALAILYKTIRLDDDGL